MKYRPDYLKTLANALWLALRHGGVKASAMPKGDIYNALAEYQEDMLRQIRDIYTEVIRRELRNTLAEIRIINGKMDSLTDRVIQLQRKLNG